MEIVPCSHVGHIFRRRSPYEWRKGKDVIRRNLVRLAKVWTDEYSKYYFEKINNELVSQVGPLKALIAGDLKYHWFCREIMAIFRIGLLSDKGSTVNRSSGT